MSYSQSHSQRLKQNLSYPKTGEDLIQLLLLPNSLIRQEQKQRDDDAFDEERVFELKLQNFVQFQALQEHQRDKLIQQDLEYLRERADARRKFNEDFEKSNDPRRTLKETQDLNALGKNELINQAEVLKEQIDLLIGAASITKNAIEENKTQLINIESDWKTRQAETIKEIIDATKALLYLLTDKNGETLSEAALKTRLESAAPTPFTMVLKYNPVLIDHLIEIPTSTDKKEPVQASKACEEIGNHYAVVNQINFIADSGHLMGSDILKKLRKEKAFHAQMGKVLLKNASRDTQQANAAVVATKQNQQGESHLKVLNTVLSEKSQDLQKVEQKISEVFHSPFSTILTPRGYQ